MQTNENDNEHTITTEELVMMFQEMLLEKDFAQSDNDVNHKVRFYETWPTNNIYAETSKVNPTTRTNLFLHNMHDEWGRKPDASTSNGCTKCSFEEFKLSIDEEIINQPKNLHKMFKHLWSITKEHTMSCLKHFYVVIKDCYIIDSGGVVKDFLEN